MNPSKTGRSIKQISFRVIRAQSQRTKMVSSILLQILKNRPSNTRSAKMGMDVHVADAAGGGIVQIWIYIDSPHADQPALFGSDHQALARVGKSIYPGQPFSLEPL